MPLNRGTAVGTELMPAVGADERGHVLDGTGTASVGFGRHVVPSRVEAIGGEAFRTPPDHRVEFGSGGADERFVQHRHRDAGRTAGGGDHTERGTATDPDPCGRPPAGDEVEPVGDEVEPVGDQVEPVGDEVESVEDEVDLRVEIHGVFARPVSGANDAVNPPTGRAERGRRGRK